MKDQDNYDAYTARLNKEIEGYKKAIQEFISERKQLQKQLAKEVEGNNKLLLEVSDLREIIAEGYSKFKDIEDARRTTAKEIFDGLLEWINGDNRMQFISPKYEHYVHKHHIRRWVASNRKKYLGGKA
jgi:DNA repair exonuclease SbcCD ATPase subunit